MSTAQPSSNACPWPFAPATGKAEQIKNGPMLKIIHACRYCFVGAAAGREYFAPEKRPPQQDEAHK